MNNYLMAGIKYIILKFFAKNIKLNGIPILSFETEISAKNGKIILGHKMSARSNVHIRANDGGKITIGKRVFFNFNCVVVGKNEIYIGDGTVFGPNVCIFDHNHKFDVDGVKADMSCGYVRIGNDCWIGSGVTILKNSEIGNGCIIGAGSVISGIIPEHSIVTMDRRLNIKKIES